MKRNDKDSKSIMPSRAIGDFYYKYQCFNDTIKQSNNNKNEDEDNMVMSKRMEVINATSDVIDPGDELLPSHQQPVSNVATVNIIDQTYR